MESNGFSKTKRRMVQVEKARRHNSTYPKVAVQWLNQALCFVLSSVLADSFCLHNPQLYVAGKRYHHC
jgi:hypothetical protein